MGRPVDPEVKMTFARSRVVRCARRDRCRRRRAIEPSVVDDVRRDARRQLHARRDLALREHERRARALEHVRDAIGGRLGVDRQIRRAREHDAERGDHLLGSLLHHDRHRLIRARAERRHVRRELAHTRRELAVRPRAIARDQRDALGGARGLREERLVDAHVGHVALRGIGGRDRRDLMRRQQREIVDGPGRGLVGEAREQVLIAREHVVDHPGREHLVDALPDQHDVVVELEHLVIEDHLRGLGDGVDDAVEPAARQRLDRILALAILRQRAREHDRDQRAAARARDLAQDRHAAEVAVLQVRPQLILQPRARASKLSPSPSRDKITDDTKSPTASLISACTGGRLKNVSTIEHAGCRLQRARISMYAAHTTPDGVRPDCAARSLRRCHARAGSVA